MHPASSAPSHDAPRALAVDDDRTSLLTLSHILRSLGWQADAVSSPSEALEKFRQSSESGILYDALLTDHLMPEMSGLELISRIQKHDPSLATILITGDAERQTLSDSINTGVLGFIEKPVRPPALRDTLERARLHTQQRRREASDQQRLREIAAIHQTLAPDQQTSILSGLSCQILTRTFPISHAGGDFLSISRRANGTVQVVLGDVSGHGLKEGFIAAFFQGMVRGMQAAGCLPGQIAAACNRFLLDEWQRGQNHDLPSSLGALFLLLDLASRRLSVLNCGCPGVGFYEPGEMPRTLAPHGMALGWFDELSAGSESLNLPRIGCLQICSDGLIDLAQHLNVQTCALAARCLLTPHGQPLDLPDRGPNPDDLLISCLRWSDLEEPNHFFPLFHAAYSGESTSSIDDIHAALERNLFLALHTIPTPLVHDITLCAREALINGWEHGCKQCPDSSAHLIVDLHLDPARPTLQFAVQDPGPGFNYHAIRRTSPKDPSDPDHISLGLSILRHLAQSMRFSRGGSRLEAVFDLPPQALPTLHSQSAA